MDAGFSWAAFLKYKERRLPRHCWRYQLWSCYEDLYRAVLFYKKTVKKFEFVLDIFPFQLQSYLVFFLNANFYVDAFLSLYPYLTIGAIYWMSSFWKDFCLSRINMLSQKLSYISTKHKHQDAWLCQAYSVRGSYESKCLSIFLSLFSWDILFFCCINFPFQMSEVVRHY